MKRYKIGYTTGVYDMFHIGHLNVLKSAKEYCDFLIVGVSTDELVQNYKNKKTIIPFEDRIQIVEAIRYVDRAVPQDSLKKLEALDKYEFNAVFVGDDWKNSESWNRYEKDFNARGVDVVYLPYTKGISSTKLRKDLNI